MTTPPPIDTLLADLDLAQTTGALLDGVRFAALTHELKRLRALDMSQQVLVDRLAAVEDLPARESLHTENAQLRAQLSDARADVDALAIDQGGWMDVLNALRVPTAPDSEETPEAWRRGHLVGEVRSLRLRAALQAEHEREAKPDGGLEPELAAAAWAELKEIKRGCGLSEGHNALAVVRHIRGLQEDRDDVTRLRRLLDKVSNQRDAHLQELHGIAAEQEARAQAMADTEAKLFAAHARISELEAHVSPFARQADPQLEVVVGD